MTGASYHEAGSARLTERARKYLRDRDISPAIARLANLRSLRPAETAALFHVRREALLVPFAPDYGVARVFDLAAAHGKFRCPAGAAPRLYEPPLPARSKLTRERVRSDPKVPLLVIEGPLKALAAAGHGLPGVGTFGCWGWQQRRVPLADLTRYVYAGRTVGPIFDADVADNWLVGLALLELGDWLTTQGATVAVRQLPRVAGRTTGLDDFLKQRGVKPLLDLPAHAWDSDFVWELRARAGFERAELTAARFRFHQLRHTFATQALAAGIAVSEVSRYLGHSSIVVTLNVYAHVLPGGHDAARAKLADLYDGVAGQPEGETVVKQLGTAPQRARRAGA